MDSKIIKKRINQIRKELKATKANFLIATKSANVRYATGFSGDDSWAVITNKNSYLITDSRYTEQAQKQCSLCEIIERKESLPSTISKLLKRQKTVETIAVEQTLSLGIYKELKKQTKIKIQITKGLIEKVRCVKNTDEISAVKSAAIIAAEALDKIRKKIQPGITECELAGALDFEIRKLNSVNSFDTIVAFGANASRPHHEPSDKKLRANDTVLIDFGAKYSGYCSDITRCFTVGRASTSYKKAYLAVENAQTAAIAQVKAGVSIKKVDQAARKIIQNAGFPVYGHGTGHGLGLEVHEKPIVTWQMDGKLQAGQIITIEPGIYLPGKFGIRIEDDILVTKTGCEILTKNCPH